ncbi:MAG: hypothetical protein ACYDCC_13865 [Actinomycetota bacterium]
MRYFVAAIALVVMLPSHALADANVDPRIHYSIETITPTIPGLSVSIYPPVTVHFPPQVVADNLSNVDVIVLDDSSKPMLRVGPAGTFFNDENAKALSALDPLRQRLRSVSRPSKNPWKKISSSRRLTWYETRALYGATGPRNPRLPTPLKTFRIPLIAGRTHVNVDGLVSWSPILGSIVPYVLSIDPRVKGVQAVAQKGVTPAIEVSNASKEVIQITGSDGLAFARVGPSGVDENVNSPQYRDTKLLPPATSHVVRWQHQQETPVVVWLDKRLLTKEPPFEQEQKATTIDLNHWTIPGTISGRPFSINGINRWIAFPAASPSTSSSTSTAKAFPWAAILGGVALGAGVGILIASRNRTPKATT